MIRIPRATIPLFSFLACLSLCNVDAFPSGAGGCSGDQGSVGGSHLTKSTIEQQSPLSEVSLNVVATSDDGNTVDLGGGASVVPGTYTVELSGNTFKGFLFRIAGASGNNVDTTGMISTADDGADSQIAAVCTSVDLGGVTHINSDDKTSASATLTIDTPGSYSLQVTAVFENGGTTSSWAHQEYLFDVTAGDGEDAPADDGAVDTSATEVATEGGDATTTEEDTTSEGAYGSSDQSSGPSSFNKTTHYCFAASAVVATLFAALATAF